MRAQTSFHLPKLSPRFQVSPTYHTVPQPKWHGAISHNHQPVCPKERRASAKTDGETLLLNALALHV
jgi:hypothetical protein